MLSFYRQYLAGGLRTRKMRTYECKVYDMQSEKSIDLLFWSEKKMELRIRDVKLFFEGTEAKKVLLYRYHYWLDHNNQVVHIPFEERNLYQCTYITFIVEDITSQIQEAISISLLTQEITYKKMNWKE